MLKTTVWPHFWPSPSEPSLMLWMIPMRTPPSDGAVRLPMPPRTAAVNANRPSRKPRSHARRPRLHPEDAGRSGEGAAEAERERDGPVDVDAHQPGGVLVLRRGAHRLALSGVLHDPGHEEQQRNGDGDDDDGRPVDVDASHREPGIAEDGVPGLLRGTVDDGSDRLAQRAQLIARLREIGVRLRARLNLRLRNSPPTFPPVAALAASRNAFGMLRATDFVCASIQKYSSSSPNGKVSVMNCPTVVRFIMRLDISFGLPLVVGCGTVLQR